MKKELIEALKAEGNQCHPVYERGIRDGFERAIEIIEEFLETEAEPLVVPKELGAWLGCQKLGNEGSLFSIIIELEDMWLECGFEEFVTDNKKQLIEVILGTRPYEVGKEKLYYAKIKGHELVDTEPKLDDVTGKDVSEWHRNIYFIQQLNKEIVIDMKDSGLRGAKHFMTIKEWAELGINEANAEFEPVEVTG